MDTRFDLGGGGKDLLSNPEPYTLHPTPHTLHPTPYTVHRTPYTLHPTPYTDLTLAVAARIFVVFLLLTALACSSFALISSCHMFRV